MIVIVGESACGKTSVLKELTDKYSFKKIVTYTTRPIRENEKNGVDYYFVSKESFSNLKYIGMFAETAVYNDWYYGSAKQDYTDNSVIILTPCGLRTIRRNGINNIYSVYIDVPRRERLIKSLERGDNIEEAYRRNLSDVGQFDGILNEVDLVIYNPNYIWGIEDIAKEIFNKYNGL